MRNFTSQRVAPDLEQGSDATELDEGTPVRVPATRRQIAVRVLGALAIAATFYGSVLILRTPDALRQAIDWATLGHADVVVGAKP